MSDGTRVSGPLARVGRRVAESIDWDPLAAAEILTDEDGVSHVYAEDRYTLAYANGYVQARDRLFEMDVLRHVGYGDSAEILGPAQLASDVQVRRDLYSEAELRAQYEAADEGIQRTLDAFANGVNRQLVEMATTASLPAEFVALGHVPKPWSAVDSVAVSAYMLGFFGVFGGDEFGNADRFAKLCETGDDEAAAFERYGDLNRATAADEHTPTVSPEELTAADTPVPAASVPAYEDVPDEQLALARTAGEAEPWGMERDLGLLSDRRGPVNRARSPGGVLTGLKWGSNALVVHGDLTETGRPMLVGGPQMGYFKPPIVHEIGLHGAGFDTVGVGVVGTPNVLVGRTPEFAWTVTSGYDDQVDTIAVELHPEDRHRYRTGEGKDWREMDTQRVVHRSSFLGSLADPDSGTGVRVLEQEVARVEIDGDRCPVIAWHPDERVAWVQRVATRGDELAGAFAWTEIGRADGYEEFLDALADLPFSFNFCYADSEDIAFVHTGRLPTRTPDLDPRLPAPAASHEWTDLRDGTDLGIVERNPAQGYYAQWNNAPVAGWPAGDEEGRWGPFHRVDLLDRIVREQLGRAEAGEMPDDADGDGRLSVADVEEVIRYAATHDPIARETAPLMARVAAESEDKRLRWMADELDDWADAGYPWRDEQRIEVYDDPGHAVWDETRRALQDLVFRPHLETLTPELQFDPPTEIDPEGDEDPHAGDHGRAVREVGLVRILDGDADGEWLDDDVEAVVHRALVRAADRLSERFGTSYPGSWRLPAHRSEFRVLGAAAPDAVPMVNRGSYNFVVALGPAGEPATAAESILPPSNSGHLPLSALVGTLRGNEPDRLTDQLDRYERFEYKPMPVERAAVERRASREKRLWLRPGRPGGVGSGLRDTLLGAGLTLTADL